MRQESVQFFTEKEEEFVNLLIEIGMKKNVAKVLVCLAYVPDATSRSIERRTGMRQPEISLAMKYLMDQGWIRIREKKGEKRGRSIKIYDLDKHITVIMDQICEEEKNKTNNQLALIGKYGIISDNNL
jgi:predicted transcriptional regulator